MKKYIAESLGTFVLIFVGIGVTLFCYKTMGILGSACAFGVTYLLCFITFGRYSGCHLNPAVSFASYLCKKINFKEFWAYLLAQFIGALIAGILILLVALFCNEATTILSDYHVTNGFDDLSEYRLNLFGAIIVELILTSVFIVTYLYVCYKKEKFNKYAGFIIAIVYILIIVVGFKLTGPAINPCRALVSALIPFVFGNVSQMSQVWLFILIPFFASVLSAVVFRKMTDNQYELRFKFLNFQLNKKENDAEKDIEKKN